MSDNSFVNSRKYRGDDQFQATKKAEDAIRDLHLTQQQLLELEQQRLEAERLRLHEEQVSREKSKQRAERHRETRKQMAALELEIKTFADDLARQRILETKADEVTFAALRFAVLRTRMSMMSGLKAELDELPDIRFFGELEYSLEHLASSHPAALGTTAVLAAEEQLANLANWPAQTVLYEGEKLKPLALYQESKGFADSSPRSLNETFKHLNAAEDLEKARHSILHHLAQTELSLKAFEKLWQKIDPILRDLAASRLGDVDIEFVTGHRPPSLFSQRQNLSDLQDTLKSQLALVEQAHAAWHEDRALSEEAHAFLQDEKFGEAEQSLSKTSSIHWRDIGLEEITRQLAEALQQILDALASHSEGKPKRERDLLEACITKYSDCQTIRSGLEKRRAALSAEINTRSKRLRRRVTLTLALLCILSLVKIASLYFDQFESLFTTNEDSAAYFREKQEAERGNVDLNQTEPQRAAETSPTPTPAVADVPTQASPIPAATEQAPAPVPVATEPVPETTATGLQGPPSKNPEVEKDKDTTQSEQSSVTAPHQATPELQQADKAAFEAGFKRIPVGSFQMGEAGDANAPVHSVSLKEYHISITEVTLGDWKAVKEWAEASGYTFEHQGGGKNNNHPVSEVSWYDAVKWCNARSERAGLMPCYYTSSSHDPASIYRQGLVALKAEMIDTEANGYRLPSEAEWEKAARGGVAGRKYPNGQTLTTRECNFSNLGGATMPVKYYIPNPYGLYEMAGNVAEWCEDLYTPGSAKDTSTKSSERSIRGGSWTDPRPDACRVAFRMGSPAESAANNRGFRLVRRIPQR